MKHFVNKFIIIFILITVEKINDTIAHFINFTKINLLPFIVSDQIINLEELISPPPMEIMNRITNAGNS